MFTKTFVIPNIASSCLDGTGNKGITLLIHQNKIDNYFSSRIGLPCETPGEREGKYCLPLPHSAVP